MTHVSVIIPNYNHAKFLKNRILSVLNQTYRDFEIICLDDASTDNSLEIISSFRNHPGLLLVANNQNSGTPFHQWNKGISLAKGEYIWIAESDDLAKPELLDRLVSVLDGNQNVGMAYCQSCYIDIHDNIIGNHFEELAKYDDLLWKNDFIRRGTEVLESHMSAINIIPNASSLLFRKSVFDQVGGADEDMRLCGDWLTWSKMLMKSDLAFIAEPLNYFRMHDLSVRSRIHCTRTYIFEYIRVVKLISSKLTIPKSSKSRISYQLKARWLKLAIENSSEVDFHSIFHVLREINLMLGIWQAFQFLLIGLLPALHFFYENRPKMISALRFAGRHTFRNCGARNSITS